MAFRENADEKGLKNSKNRFSDDDESENTRKPGFSPKELFLRIQNWTSVQRQKAYTISLGLIGLGLILLVFWTFIVVIEMRRPTLEMAVRALDFGAYNEAIQYAKSVLRYASKKEVEKRSGALYVLGVATSRLSEQAWVVDKTQYYRIAADALAESREGGFLAGHVAEGYFYLGESLFHGKKYTEAIESLETALELHAPNEKITYWYLANAHYYSRTSNFQKALDYLDKFDKMGPFLEREKQKAALLRTTIYLRLDNKLEEARKVFETVPENTPFFLEREFTAGRISLRYGDVFRQRAENLQRNPQLSVTENDLEQLRIQLQKTPILEPEQEVPRRLKQAFPFPQNQDQEDTTTNPETPDENDDHNPFYYQPESPSKIEMEDDAHLPQRKPSTRNEYLLPKSFPDDLRKNLYSKRLEIPEGCAEPKSTARTGCGTWVPVVYRRNDPDDDAVPPNENPRENKNSQDQPNDFEQLQKLQDAKVLTPDREREDFSPFSPEADLTGDFSSKAMVIKKWRLLADQKYHEAIRHFQTVRRHDTDILDWYRQAALLEGLSHERLGDPQRAQEEYYTIARTFQGTVEGVLAKLRWAYIEFTLNHEEEGLVALGRALEDFQQHPEYLDSWMSVDSIIDMANKSINSMIDIQQYEKAVRLLEYFGKLMPEVDQSRIYARLYIDWGDMLQNQAKTMRLDEYEKTMAAAREKYAEAGKWYQTLAEWTFTMPEFLHNVWESAENYRYGRDYLRAIEMYRLFLEHNQLIRQAQAHYYIGEMLFQLDEIEIAATELTRCLENYPNDQIAGEARLTTAYVFEEKNNLDHAIRLLAKNINGNLSPAAEVYRESLFELGRLYLKTKQYDRVMETLGDALKMYPDAQRAPEAHYLLANAFLNVGTRLKSEIEASPRKDVKVKAERELAGTQHSALEHLKQARELLLKREDGFGLTASEERMLRNAFFLTGRLLTEMGPEYYEESVLENRHAIARYQGHPDVLQAYLQLVRVYQLQDDSVNAQKMKNQARVLFQKFQANKAFQQETVYTEQQWEEMLK
ncbi:MAG: tetratricopeptide repeat protein [Planctomycetaceae bacterium]|nr:tetratricopeptide repeat protein [Planctomycetaceae bacterium]